MNLNHGFAVTNAGAEDVVGYCRQSSCVRKTCVGQHATAGGAWPPYVHTLGARYVLFGVLTLKYLLSPACVLYYCTNASASVALN